MAKAVILNDTRGDNHFGCFRVMRVIEENLAARGIEVIGRSLVRNDWARDGRLLQALRRSDLVLINGEGTLHHGNGQGQRLLEVVDHLARGDKPVALINTIYQANPPEWRHYLDKIALVSTRDSRSAQAISDLTGKPCSHVPDLSLGEGQLAAEHPGRRTDLLVGDSVDRHVTAALIDLAAATPKARFLPILKTLKASKPHYGPLAYGIREAYIKLHATVSQWRRGNIEFNENEAGFIASLQRAQLHVTGRFHAVCFCLFTQTPFVAVKSNSWKINALLEDFGLSDRRVMPVETIRARLAAGESFHFSEAEKQIIAERLLQCRRETKLLFDQVAALATQKAAA
jgi:hypothetical protein